CRVYTVISKEKEFPHHEQVFHTDDPIIASFINVSTLFNRNHLVLFFTSWFLTFFSCFLSETFMLGMHLYQHMHPRTGLDLAYVYVASELERWIEEGHDGEVVDIAFQTFLAAVP
ncbi:hypothetical protein ACJX0J_034932, partial [Zea mays]